MPKYDGQRFSPPAPTGTVSITNPDTRSTLTGVNVLLDTGADISVLPRSAVDALGLPAADSSYEVMAYDNTVRECRARRSRLSPQAVQRPVLSARSRSGRAGSRCPEPRDVVRPVTLEGTLPDVI